MSCAIEVEPGVDDIRASQTAHARFSLDEQPGLLAEMCGGEAREPAPQDQHWIGQSCASFVCSSSEQKYGGFLTYRNFSFVSALLTFCASARAAYGLP
jgi:hypothetical protein